MALVVLAVTGLAAFAVSMSVYSVFGSILLAVLAYAVIGSVLLFCVLFTALLREQSELAEMSDPLLFPAE